MSYKIKVLSPLHIGCGETYTGLNYILEGNQLFYIDSDTFLALLAGNVEEFVKWIELNSQKTESLESQKRKTRDRDKKRSLNRQINETKGVFNIGWFCRKIGISVSSVRDNAAYSLKCNGGINNGLEINPYIKQMNQAYIPGTEVKGAIRTAMTYCALVDNAEIYEWLKNKMINFGKANARKIAMVANSKRPNTNIKKELVKEMGGIEQKLQEMVFNSMSKDAKYDLLKYLNIGDSELKNPEDVLLVAYAKPVNISLHFSIYYEYVKPGSEFSLTDLTLEDTKSRNKKMEKMFFSNRHKEMVSSLDEILQYCYRFCEDIFDEELEFFTNRHKDNDILDHLNIIASCNKPDSPVLRIGKDEGYLSITAALAVKKNDPDLYENVLIHATKSRSYTGSNLLPKSRKIVYYDGKKLTSGWVQLIKDAPSGADQDNKTRKARNNQSVDITPLLKKYGKHG